MAHLVCVQLEAILEQLGSVILANVLPVSAMILKLVVYAYGYKGTIILTDVLPMPRYRTLGTPHVQINRRSHLGRCLPKHLKLESTLSTSNNIEPAIMIVKAAAANKCTDPHHCCYLPKALVHFSEYFTTLNPIYAHCTD
jgi:hypothetical protein